jgi:hypothetical protein
VKRTICHRYALEDTVRILPVCDISQRTFVRRIESLW